MVQRSDTLCTMNQQLTLDFPENPSPDRLWRVAVYVNGAFDSALSQPLPWAEAVQRREQIVKRLADNPTSTTVWEDSARPTGWYGLQPGPQGATVYEVAVVAAPNNKESSRD